MEITREELARLYEELSSKELMKALGGVCSAKMYKLLDEAGIERKRQNIAQRRHVNVKLVD